MPILLAAGTLGGSTDQSGLTGLMENGLPGNFLGGTGSGLAWAGGNTFLGLPDRGPNATLFNSALDDTVSYISRFHTMSLTLTPSGGALPFSLGATLNATTLLYSTSPLIYGSGAGLGNQFDGTPLPTGDAVNTTSGVYYFTGRSDNYGSGDSLNPAFARFDPEAIRLSNDGKSVFVSDEYGTYVRQFDASSGALIKTFTLPSDIAISTLSPNVAVERTVNTSGRFTNSGMEGMAITPDGKTLVGMIQGALLQDRAAGEPNLLRIVTIDIATGNVVQYAYKLTSGTGISEIVALSDTEFMIIERDGRGLGGTGGTPIKDVYLIDLAGATPIDGLSTAAAAAAIVSKTKVLDIGAMLTAAGLPIPSKIEGLAFGEDVTHAGDVYHTLFVSDDNDFLPATSGDNHFYVFGFTDAELATYGATFVPQALAAVPEPSTWAMMIAGFGMVGFGMRRRKANVTVRYA